MARAGWAQRCSVPQHPQPQLNRSCPEPPGSAGVAGAGRRASGAALLAVRLPPRARSDTGPCAG